MRLFFSVSETLVVPASRARVSIVFFTFRYMLQFLWYFLLSDFSPLRIALRVEWRVALNHVKNAYNGARLQ